MKEKRETEIENVRKSSEISLPMTSLLSDSTIQELEEGDDLMIVPKAPPGISGTALAASLLREGRSLAKMYEQCQDEADALRHEGMSQLYLRGFCVGLNKKPN